MKKRIFALALLFAFAACFGLTACKKKEPTPTPPPNTKANQTIYAFATTQNTSHSGLAFVTLKTNDEGNIAERYLDEAFIPNEWAKLTVQDAMALGATWDETTTTKLIPGDAVMVANIASGGSWTAATAPTFYPRYIELTLGGATQLYKAKLVTIANNSNNATYGEASENEVATTEPAESTHEKFIGTEFEAGSAGCVRYYPVSGFGQNPATEAKSLEYKLSTDYDYAKSYVETLRAYELADTNPADINTTAIKYVKSETEKIDTVRLAARKAYAAQDNTATATVGRIALGRAMKTGTETDLTGSSLAYATTFFKRGSTYGSNMKVLPIVNSQLDIEGTLGVPAKLTDENGTWEAVDRGYKAFLDKAGIENLTAAELLKLEKAGNVWKYDFGTTASPKVVSIASAYHANIYLSLYLKAYAKLAAL